MEAEYHIYAITYAIIVIDNGLSPGKRHAITSTNAGISFIGPTGTNFNKIIAVIHAFLFTKIY